MHGIDQDNPLGCFDRPGGVTEHLRSAKNLHGCTSQYMLSILRRWKVTTPNCGWNFTDESFRAARAGSGRWISRRALFPTNAGLHIVSYKGRKVVPRAICGRLCDVGVFLKLMRYGFSACGIQNPAANTNAPQNGLCDNVSFLCSL